MDNQTRRILLERVKASGFPGSILDVFQNPAILDQFIAEQQQSQLQQPQNIQVVAETPEQQRQGLRPYHNNNITNVEMAFPNVETNQVINTERMKIPINVDVIKQGNLVQSFKAIPPGIANFPTGSPEGATLIESPAEGYAKTGGIRKYQTGRFKYQAGSEAAADATDVIVNPLVDLRDSSKVKEILDAEEKLRFRKELDTIQSSPGSFQDYKRADQIMREIKSRWPEDDSLTMTEDVRMQQLGKQLIQTPLPYDNITIGQDIKDATSEAIAAKKAQDQYIENLKKKIKQTGGTKTYLKGGLKNRVLYNKAKYKR